MISADGFIQAVDREKFEEYRRAVRELGEAVTRLRNSSDWDRDFQRYGEVDERVKKAKAALFETGEIEIGSGDT